MIDTFSHYLNQEDPDCVYLPSRDEIQMQCEEIRTHWSEREYMKRSHITPERWTAPIVSICMEQANLPDD